MRWDSLAWLCAPTDPDGGLFGRVISLFAGLKDVLSRLQKILKHP